MNPSKFPPADIKQVIVDTQYNEAMLKKSEQNQKKVGSKKQKLKHEQETDKQESSGSKPVFREKRLPPESLKKVLSDMDALAKRRNLPAQNLKDIDKEFTAEELESLKKLARTI